MKACDVLKQREGEIFGIHPDKTVLEAIGKMVELRIGSLVVLDDGGALAGIITERDILNESAARSAKLAETRVSAVMTRELVTGELDDDLNQLLNVMTEKRVRHIPILSGGKLEGLLSIGDLVKAQLELIREENKHLRDYIQGG